MQVEIHYSNVSAINKITRMMIVGSHAFLK